MTVVGEVTSLPEIQQQFPIPVREDVPMEEQEARANRFVSLLVGRTDSDRLPKPSRKLRHWQRRVVKEERERQRPR